MPSNYPGALDTDANLYVAVNLRSTILTAPTLTTDTIIAVLTTTGYPDVGILRLEEPDSGLVEFRSYTGKTINSFTGMTPGVDALYPAQNHAAGVSVTLAVVAQNHNALKDANKAEQATLGINPQGASATVAARLTTMEAATTAAQADIDAHQADADPHTQYQKESEKAVANGYASLDSGGKIPANQLPNSVMAYQGTWNASTNSPTLADGAGSQGDVYRVQVAGSQDLGSGSITFDVGDYVILNASLVWEKADTTDAVASVNGMTGTVVLTTTNIAEGTNLYFTNARAQTAVGTTGATSGRVGYSDGANALAFNANLFFDSASGQLRLAATGSSGGLLIGGDVQLFQGAANRLDLASGDSFNIVTGDLTIASGQTFLNTAVGLGGQSALHIGPTSIVGSATARAPGFRIGNGSTSAFTGATAQTGDVSIGHLTQITLTNATAGTVVDASTLRIDGAPLAGSGMTLTNAYSLLVSAGPTRLNGQLGIGVKPTVPLHVSSTTQNAIFDSSGVVSLAAAIQFKSGNNGMSLFFNRNGNNQCYFGFSSNSSFYINTTASDDPSATTDASSQICIPASGNSNSSSVGINTKSPTAVAGLTVATAKLAPVGGASQVIGRMDSPAQTIAFATSPQTGDFIGINVGQITLTNPSSGTITNATTLKIIGAPISGANAPLTNRYAMWVLADATRLDGALLFSTDVQISRGSADRLDLASGDSIRIATDGSTGSLQFGASGDASLYRGAADKLYLATGDSLHLVSGNVELQAASIGTSGIGVLGIAIGTEPSTSPADNINLYTVDVNGAGTASIGLRTEQATEVNTDTASHILRVKINGVVYGLLLTDSP